MADNTAKMYKEMQKMNNDTQVKLQELTNSANKQTLDYNKQEAATARAWQKQMSETSHQMEVKDLIKAGLNPVLSANSGGAQSYSTSSASAQAESGANAMASLQGSYMSSYAGLKGTELSAAAQKQAAATAAAATRAAAAEAAAATRYAASMSYQQNADRIAFEKWKVQNEPSGNPIKILDRELKNNAPNAYSSIKSFINSIGKTLIAEPFKFSKDGKSTPKNYSDLNQKGKIQIDKGLRKVGLDTSYRDSFYKATVLGSQYHQRLLEREFNNRKSVKARLRTNSFDVRKASKIILPYQ